MEEIIDPFNRLSTVGKIRDISIDEFNGKILKRFQAAGLSNQGADMGAFSDEKAGEVGSDESGSPCDETLLTCKRDTHGRITKCGIGGSECGVSVECRVGNVK